MIVLFSSLAALFVAYLIYLIFFWQWEKSCQPYYNTNETLIVGHRGSPTHITENTLPSFKKAISQGVDGLELDIRLTKDNQLAVFHDADLRRLSKKTTKINKLSLTELQTIKLNKEEGQQEDVFIPSLNDLLPLFEQMKVINIEIKSEGALQGHTVLKPLIQFLDKNNFDDRCIVSSFNPLILMKLRLRRPHTVIGFLYNKNKLFHGWDNMIWMLRVQPENLHIHYSLLNHWIVKWARKKGMRINSYTINDKKAFNEAKVDGVFTDNIEYIK